ncbi:MAG TPA: ABC transporter permease [Acidobacteriaceae bacterium]|nr:ABC transporter permease [Acidobacteriaceae bacterium]
MSIVSRLRATLRNWMHRQRVDDELDEEVRAYAALVAEEKAARGMPAGEARRRALAEMGGTEAVKEAVRAARAGTQMELLWQDFRYGLRQLRRNPAFTWTAILTLGLGIGATTSIFSVVYCLLLRPLPYAEAGRLASIALLPSPDFVAARENLHSFAGLAGYDEGSDNLTGVGAPVRVTRAGVTANLLPMLGVQAQRGRVFSARDDRPGGPPVIVLSHRLWQSQFGGDRSVVGRAVTINGVRQTIIGVLPAHFSFPDAGLEPDYYAPADLNAATTFAVTTPVEWIRVIGKLRPGVTVEAAQAEVKAYFQARAHTYPAAFWPWAEHREVVVESLQRHLTGDQRQPLWVLLACVGAVLLIACANVANLQLARAVARRQETAIRGALGASRTRLVRQFLVEGLTLSLAAAGLGLAIAGSAAGLIRHVSAPGAVGMAAEWLRVPLGKAGGAVQVDGWVFAFAGGLALMTTVLFGLMPALGATGNALRRDLKTAGLRVSAGREQRKPRSGLLIAEVGLAVALLASAGLLVRSFANVMRYDSGFDPSHTLTAMTLLGDQESSQEHTRAFIEQVVTRLRALPGVEAAAVTSTLPVQPIAMTPQIFPAQGAIPPVGNWLTTPSVGTAQTTSVTPDYFRAVGTPVLRGRAFNRGDGPHAPRVAIVNQAFAKRFLDGEALGKAFRTNLWQGPFHYTVVTVVGVVPDVRHGSAEHVPLSNAGPGSLEDRPEPEAFLPESQMPNGNVNLVLRTSVDPASLSEAVRRAVAEIDPAQPLFDVETMEERVADTVAQRRLVMLLTVCFAGLAVVLAGVGVYGVFAYSVSQRRQEMGIRLALGASRGRVVRLIVVQAARLIVAGGALGMGAALLLSRLLANMLVGVSAHDAVSFLAACGLMMAIAIVASAIPAAAAGHTDLIAALRAE